MSGKNSKKGLKTSLSSPEARIPSGTLRVLSKNHKVSWSLLELSRMPSERLLDRVSLYALYLSKGERPRYSIVPVQS